MKEATQLYAIRQRGAYLRRGLKIAWTMDITEVRLYARLYPLFQAEYVELGYPDGYFNDRLVQVLDHLLATPEPAGPLAVQLTPVEGEVPSLQPWVRYEFADPALEAASAGQKIMLRVGAVNERRLKAQLRALRAELVRQAKP